MKATILTIGDEILIGQIVDTNSVSIAKHLNTAGIVVREKISIGDDRTQILDTVSRALHDSEVTVITGASAPRRTTSPRRPSPNSSAAACTTTRP